MNAMSRLVLQNWRKSADLRESWAEDEPQVRAAIDAVGGLSVVALEPGSGLVEFDPRRTGSVTKVKRSLERVLPHWKIYEWNSYDLPSHSS